MRSANQDDRFVLLPPEGRSLYRLAEHLRKLIPMIAANDIRRFPEHKATRVALFEAAHVMLTRSKHWSKLKAWAVAVAKRRGAKRAKVALARKMAVKA